MFLLSKKRVITYGILKCLGLDINLQMVAGANHLLETFKSRLVTVRVSYEQKESTDICLTRQYYRIFGGATYKVSNLEGFTKEVWICPVTLFVLDKYPKRIYVSNSQK